MSDWDISSVLPYVDIADGLKRVRDNTKIYKMLLGSFLKKTYIDELNGHLSVGAMDEAARSAHALKGVAANLSLKQVYGTVVELEATLKEGRPYAEKYAQLIGEVSETVTAVETTIANLA